MNAQRARVSTGPSGVSPGLPAGTSFLPARAAVFGGGGCLGCAAAVSVPPAKMADANNAFRRVSIATRLLLHDDPRIGYSGAQHLVQHVVGLLHAVERADVHPMRLRASVARAVDRRAKSADAAALDGGVFIGLERAE